MNRRERQQLADMAEKIEKMKTGVKKTRQFNRAIFAVIVLVAIVACILLWGCVVQFGTGQSSQTISREQTIDGVSNRMTETTIKVSPGP
jgi:hypothetical protein